MSKLTPKRIEELSNRPNVRAICVENFLGSLGTLSKRDAGENLRMDTRLYGWNAPTVKAINVGIKEYYA